MIEFFMYDDFFNLQKRNTKYWIGTQYKSLYHIVRLHKLIFTNILLVPNLRLQEDFSPM